MEQTEIILKVNPYDLKDIYFGQRDHVIFFGPNTKAVSLGLVSALILCPLFTAYALSIHEGGLVFLAAMLFFAAIVTFWSVAKPIITWKRTVSAFLEHANSIQVLKVIFNDEFIHHIQDETETKLNWSAVERATITSRFIELHASTHIFLPKSAMTPQQYQVLCDQVMNKVQEVQKN